MQKYFGAGALVVIMFVAGLVHIHYTTGAGSTVARDPAAIGKTFDFSHLHGNQLQEAVKQRLVTGFSLKKSNEGAEVGLGHFVYQDDRGQRRLACQEFSKVTLTFEGEGSSVAGARPVMDVEGVCEFSPDMARINPLMIPIAKIVGEKPADGEFQFQDGSPITVRFTNVSDEWPRTWILKSIKLDGDKNAQAVVVEGPEVVRYLGHPLVLNF